MKRKQSVSGFELSTPTFISYNDIHYVKVISVCSNYLTNYQTTATKERTTLYCNSYQASYADQSIVSSINTIMTGIMNSHWLVCKTNQSLNNYRSYKLYIFLYKACFITEFLPRRLW